MHLYSLPPQTLTATPTSYQNLRVTWHLAGYFSRFTITFNSSAALSNPLLITPEGYVINPNNSVVTAIFGGIPPNPLTNNICYIVSLVDFIPNELTTEYNIGAMISLASAPSANTTIYCNGLVWRY
ncbi:hypothetical protein [Methylacidiphilum caldifontis]|uniref:Uncharacterized protein n=1 Tax=Methylacidiphilum caldifontis TaxID=2795386 RepID=A0A4Y8P8Q0_9BACT|nr:hypothetical protein [Methylacidiphilum caldifontis]TFE66585.1 hypothetical protein A7Q10_02080 [Methylacidiphilum caldifontis]